MTTLREAAQQALEALLTYEQYIQPLTNYFGGPRVPEEGSASAKVDAAITALRAALAEPEQEPVAWLRVIDGKLTSNDGGNFGKEWTPLYTAPPQRKPLAEWQINDLIADIDPEDVCSWSFRQGVYAAEKHHGVKP